MKVGFRSQGAVSDLDIASRNGFEVIELMWENYAMDNRDSIKKELESRKIGVSAEPHSASWCGEMLETGLILAKRHLEQFII
jgi:sugar phosphate isomerase/epimerase